MPVDWLWVIACQDLPARVCTGRGSAAGAQRCLPADYGRCRDRQRAALISCPVSGFSVRWQGGCDSKTSLALQLVTILATEQPSAKSFAKMNEIRQLP